MKVKTNTLIDPALDWAVAKAMWGVVEVGTFGPLFGRGFKAPCINGRTSRFKPSTDWSQGGPIIEREWLTVNYYGFSNPPYWTAQSLYAHYPKQFGCAGPTMLIAAMRCYVASRLGDEVDVPEELL